LLQVIRNLKWTKAGDVFSFGVLAYEVFSGGLQPYVLLRNETLISKLANPRVAIPPFLFGELWLTLSPALCDSLCVLFF
jgi:hypothetical protein